MYRLFCLCGKLIQYVKRFGKTLNPLCLIKNIREMFQKILSKRFLLASGNFATLLTTCFSNLVMVSIYLEEVTLLLSLYQKRKTRPFKNKYVMLDAAQENLQWYNCILFRHENQNLKNVRKALLR